MPFDPQMLGQMLMQRGGMPQQAPMSGAGALGQPMAQGAPMSVSAPGAQYLQNPAQMPFRPPMLPAAPNSGLPPHLAGPQFGSSSPFGSPNSR